LIRIKYNISFYLLSNLKLKFLSTLQDKKPNNKIVCIGKNFLQSTNNIQYNQICLDNVESARVYELLKIYICFVYIAGI